MAFKVIKFCKHSPGALTLFFFSFSSLSPVPLTTPSTSQLLCLPQCALYSEDPSDICIPSKLFFLVLLRCLYFARSGISLLSTCCTARANSVKVNCRMKTSMIRESTGLLIAMRLATLSLLCSLNSVTPDP